MKDISIENIKLGMRLAKDVHDRNGRMLVAAGVELTEAHLKTFKVWRVATVSVESASGESGGIEDKVNPVIKKRTELKFKQLFQNADISHPFMRCLYEYAFRRALRAKTGPGA